MKKKRIKNIPKYAFGTSTSLPTKIVPSAAVQSNINAGWNNSLNAAGSRVNAQQGVGGLGGAIGGIGGSISTLTSLIGGKSTATTDSQVATQTIGDVGKGAAAGAQAGMAFGPVGAVIGGIGGAVIGGIGKSGGIHETKGFTEDNTYTLNTGFKAFGNGSLKRKIKKDKRNVQENKIAVAGTERLQNDWSEDNIDTGTTFAYGGTMPSALAYVDDGELLQTPDGMISSIPEEGKPTDSNLVNLPGGTRILSDKLKVPGMKKTFAQVGKNLMSKKDSNNKDRFAESSRMLNQLNDKQIHDELFDIQEAVKPKSKQIQKYAKGGATKTAPSVYDYLIKNNKLNTAKQIIDNTPTMSTLTNPVNIATKAVSTNNIIKPTTEVASVPQSATTKTNRDYSSIMNGLGNIGTNLASITPALSNMLEGDAESVSTNQNPYANTIINTMRKRRYNITPVINALKESRAIANYNAGRVNTSTGANMAYRTQTATALDTNIANLYAQASNAQNQYDADYANTLNNLGQQNVSATNLSQDINARNQASVRNIRRTGLSQLSEYAQTQQQMRNQQNRDKAIMPFLQQYLNAGYSQDTVNNLMKYYN